MFDTTNDESVHTALLFGSYLLQTHVPVRIALLMVNEGGLESDEELNSNTTITNTPTPSDPHYPLTTAALRELIRLITTEVDGQAAFSFLFQWWSDRTATASTTTTTLGHALEYAGDFFRRKFRFPEDAWDDYVDMYFFTSASTSTSSTPLTTETYTYRYRPAVKFARKKNLRPGMSFYNGIPLPR